MKLDDFFVFLEEADLDMDDLFKIVVATNHKLMKTWREIENG